MYRLIVGNIAGKWRRKYRRKKKIRIREKCTEAAENLCTAIRHCRPRFCDLMVDLLFDYTTRAILEYEQITLFLVEKLRISIARPIFFSTNRVCEDLWAGWKSIRKKTVWIDKKKIIIITKQHRAPRKQIQSSKLTYKSRNKYVKYTWSSSYSTINQVLPLDWKTNKKMALLHR